MKRYDKYKRTRWHKFRMWIEQITLEDVMKAGRLVWRIVGDLIAILLMLGFITFLPHFFH